MKRNRALTKKMLQEWGVKEVFRDEHGVWWMLRESWPKGPKTEKTKKTIVWTKENKVTCKHKYTGIKVYNKFTFLGHTITTARVVYAWFVGDIQDGYEIDHLDNNPFNNDPWNLKQVTTGENLAKRLRDNGYTDTYINQYNWWKTK